VISRELKVVTYRREQPWPFATARWGRRENIWFDGHGGGVDQVGELDKDAAIEMLRSWLLPGLVITICMLRKKFIVLAVRVL
jgi:hypothetical protein